MTQSRTLRQRWRVPQGYGLILRVGLPLVASMASSTVMQFTDRLFLSLYSVDAIAAALPASLASVTIMLTLMGFCGYATVLIAQYIGSGAPHRVGSALWQGIWSALAGSILLCSLWWVAEPLFALAGHEPQIQVMEVDYFRILSVGSGLALFGAALGGFFSGRGQTRPVMVANIAAAIINIPLDYLLIFGGFGLPPMGIVGAGIATVFGWFLCALILALLIFTKKHEKEFKVLSSWPFEWGMFKRLLRYGLPSGVNFFMELAAITWFSFEVGVFGKNALAASNIAFSISSLTFVPMLGLNMAIATLVGQAMGRGNPLEAEKLTIKTMHIAFAYMVPLAIFIALAAGPLMDIFSPGDMTAAEFAPIRDLGVLLLYFIAIYSLVDAVSIVLFGAMKGAGDTLGVMYLLMTGLLLLLIAPILLMKHFGFASIINYWIAFTTYIVVLAAACLWRFFRRKWYHIRVVETASTEK